MHSKVLDVADINHVDHNCVDQSFNAFDNWSTTAQVTAKDKATCLVEDKDRNRRSDSFSDDWQDHTSELSVNDTQATTQYQPQLNNAANLDAVNFTSLSKTVFSQCFHSNSFDSSSSSREKFDPHEDQ